MTTPERDVAALKDELRALLAAATPIYDGLYAVDREGRVFSTTRWRGHDVRLLTPFDEDGYLRVRLTLDGKRYTVPVHRLVCEAFLGPRPFLHEARHLNGNSHDNRAVNLAWGTAAENAADRTAHGRTATGSRNGAQAHPDRLARGAANGYAKLTDDRVRYLRAEVAGGRTATAVAAELGISFSAACRVIRGETWTHVR